VGFNKNILVVHGCSSKWHRDWAYVVSHSLWVLKTLIIPVLYFVRWALLLFDLTGILKLLWCLTVGFGFSSSRPADLDTSPFIRVADNEW